LLVVEAILMAQDQPYKISVDVSVVTVEALVQDQSGRALTDLAQTDFEIFEDGQPQELLYFASTETPRSVMLLFDISGSTDSQRPFMVQACNVFLARMRPHDRVALASFASDLMMLMNWRDVEGKPQDVRMPSPQFSSNVYRSIEKAAATFKNEKARKGMIVMTDGRDTDMVNEVIRTKKVPESAGDKSFQRTLDNVKKSGVPLYFIALNTDRNRAFTPGDFEYTRVMALGPAVAEQYLAAVRMRMERLAEATGGRTLYPQTLREVVPLYEAISRDFGLSYSLGYSAKNRAANGKVRKIEVRVRRDGAKVTQSRDSYTR
jgi:Ca-activated chloride channel family protein